MKPLTVILIIESIFAIIFSAVLFGIVAHSSAALDVGLPTVETMENAALEPDVETAAAPTSLDRWTMMAGDPATLCRASTDGSIRICLHPNGSGTLSAHNGVTSSQYLYAYYAEAGGCPPAPDGFALRVTDWTVDDLFFFGLTQNDFDSLGLPEFYCSFAPR